MATDGALAAGTLAMLFIRNDPFLLHPSLILFVFSLIHLTAILYLLTPALLFIR